MPHIYSHGVRGRSEDVLRRSGEDRPAQKDRVWHWDRTRAGRYLRVIYVPDPEPDSVFVITALRAVRESLDCISTPQAQETTMKENRFPPGWNEQRVRDVLGHYEAQTDEEALAEDEASFEDDPETIIKVPTQLVPAVRELIGRHDSPNVGR